MSQQYHKTNARFNRDLTDQILQDSKHKNVVGRYSVSKIWGILNGYLTPEQYIKGEEHTLEDILRMNDGTMKHNFIEKYAVGETEVKKEYDCGDFVIVGKADELTDEAVIEYKTSAKLYDKPKSWHTLQVKFYLTIFERDLGIIYQPKIIKGRFILDTLGICERDDKWVAEQINKLRQFHLTLLGKKKTEFKNGKTSLKI
jgi:hypothetical protein